MGQRKLAADATCCCFCRLTLIWFFVVVDVVSNAAVVDIAVVFDIGFLARSSRFQIAVLINNRLINQSS